MLSDCIMPAMYLTCASASSYPGGLRPDHRARCFSASAGEHGTGLWTGQRGPESATKNLENSKQRYEKLVISFVKLACLFCKASARRRSSDLIFFCKVSSSTSDFLSF